MLDFKTPIVFTCYLSASIIIFFSLIFILFLQATVNHTL